LIVILGEKNSISSNIEKVRSIIATALLN